MKVVIGLLLAFALAACGKEYPAEWGDAVCDWHLEPDMRPYLADEEHMHGGRAEIRDWRAAYEGVCSGIASYPDGASEVIILWGSWFDHPVFLNPDGVDGPYLLDLLRLTGGFAQEVLDHYASDYPAEWGDAVCDWHLVSSMRPYLAGEEHMHGGRAEIRDWRAAYEGVCSGIASYPDGTSEVIVLWGSWLYHPEFLNPDGVDGPYLSGGVLGLAGDRAQEVLDDYASGRLGAR